MKLIIENIRSYSGRHEIPIRPLTLLVGENNSGKSTLLACLQAACQYPEFPFRTRWNAAPYRLGTFDTIATRKTARSGGPTAFSIGIEDLELNDSELSAVFTKVEDRIVPASLRARWHKTVLDLAVSLDGAIPPTTAYAKLTHARHAAKLEGDWPVPLFGFDPIWSVIESVGSAVPPDSTQDSAAATAASEMKQFWSARQVKRPGAISLGPRRVDPERSFSIEKLAEDEQGSDYPAILMQHSEDQFSVGHATRAGMFEALAAFGTDSGLFSRVKVKRTGTGGSRSIQVQVRVGTRHYDLTDVGYGVSQVLPVLVKTFASVSTSAILIQQPEVHLHPQAQAALGSFFVRLAASGGPALVLETHSDYVLDRVRIEVAQGRIDPNHVLLLYLEKPDAQTAIHPIGIDDCGNIVSAPPSYREFFMREEISLLTRTKKS